LPKVFFPGNAIFSRTGNWKHVVTFNIFVKVTLINCGVFQGKNEPKMVNESGILSKRHKG
jgi:hypothetical protein